MKRLASFLPEIKQANNELISKDPKAYCIENDEEDDQVDDKRRIIEMDLGLGVFEQKQSHEEEEEEEESRLSELKLPNTDGATLGKRSVIISDSSSSMDGDME